jgi:hypothetical protein
VDIESAPLQRVRVFDAFRHRDFRLLWSGQFVSLIGDAAFFTALGWRAFTLVGSPGSASSSSPRRSDC